MALQELVHCPILEAVEVAEVDNGMALMAALV
jgi:hypothetical protein